VKQVHLRIRMRPSLADKRSKMKSRAKPFRNKVLASLPAAELNRLSPHLVPIALPQHKSLLDGKATAAYFLEEGIASVVVTLRKGETVEVGVIGHDGLVGIPTLLGVENGTSKTFMQIQGSGYSIKPSILREQFEQPGELRQTLQKYMQAFMVQTAQTAACNRVHGIEARLARWLLACRDRMPSDQLRLTQTFLGQMLGAPRTTVTLAVGILERAGLIEHSRGVVIIRNRRELEKMACECYRIVRDEYKSFRLL
jgi:CRP-like cAMP-binding protein